MLRGRASRFGSDVRTMHRADAEPDAGAWAVISGLLTVFSLVCFFSSFLNSGIPWELRKWLLVIGVALFLGGLFVRFAWKRAVRLQGRLFFASAIAGVLALVILLGQWIVPAVGNIGSASYQQLPVAQPPAQSQTQTVTPTPAPSTGQNGQAQGSSTGNRGSNPIPAGSGNGTSGTGQQSSGSNGNTKQVVQPTPKAYETCYYTAYDAAKGSNNFGPRLKKETKQAAVDRAVWKIKNDCLWAATKVWMHDNKVSDPNKVDLNAVRSLAMKYDADPAKWRSDVARVNKDVKSVKFVKVSKHYSTLGMKTYSDGSMPTLLKSHETAAQGWTLVTTYHNGTVLQQRTACDMQFSIPDKA